MKNINEFRRALLEDEIGEGVRNCQRGIRPPRYFLESGWVDHVNEAYRPYLDDLKNNFRILDYKIEVINENVEYVDGYLLSVYIHVFIHDGDPLRYGWQCKVD